MSYINIKRLFINKASGRVIIVMSSAVLAYLLISVYFAYHFFFNTKINGVNVSLKSYKNADKIIKSYVKDYSLQLLERNGENEDVKGQDIGMGYNEKSDIYKIYL